MVAHAIVVVISVLVIVALAQHASATDRAAPAPLDFDWSEKRWTDPLTGTDVICLSPPDRKAHFRNPYFRINMFTADGRYAVFCEHESLKNGRGVGAKRLWARDLVSGELRDLGEVPGSTGEWIGWAVSWQSHLVNVVDRSDSKQIAVIQIDIDTGQRQRIVPQSPLPNIYDAAFSAVDRYIYTPLYGDQFDGMPHTQRVAQAPDHDMVRIDLATGAVESVFTANGWLIGHPNPNPVDPNRLMCCQEWYGEDPNSEWGRAKEHERIRIFDLSTRKWLDNHRRTPLQSTHEHWSINGKRVYGHGWVHGLNAINRIDPAAGTNEWFICPPDTGDSIHVRVAPNEQFVVGDGANFDRSNVPDDLRQRIEQARESGDFGATWMRADVRRTNGGEIIWKYKLPQDNLFDYAIHGADRQRLVDDIAANPDGAVKTTPICRFRSLGRTLMLGQRLESNAQVTPDSRWVIFQSSSEDDWFQVWAARVPGEVTSDK